MTVTEKPPLRFSLKILPWLIALAALGVYLATASGWVTSKSLPITSKLLGWDWWSIQALPPLLYLVTLPIAWLPAGSAPAVMNALTAILAALTLSTLTRTVALLPQDRTREQRQKERTTNGLLSIPTNWIPPLFAALTLGLQMSFWEHATALTGEMLNLLLFGHIIRCLLEYRQEKKTTWLYQFVFFYGLATTNNWAMIGFFPFFLITLIWFQGKSFFKLRLLAKFAGFGLLGLSLYLLMPLVESLRGNGDFVTLLHEQLGQQKLALRTIPPWLPLILSLVVFLPLISIGIRWPSNMGEANPIASFLTLLMFYLVHAMFLGFSIWVMFDPVYSPRGMAMGVGIPQLTFLTFNYLIALNIGYYSGYFLLIFRQGDQRGWKRQSSLNSALGWLITILMWTGPFVTAGALAYRNFPTIRGNNTQALKEYAQRMAAQLPETSAILLSSDPQLILLLEAHFASEGKNPHLMLDTRFLPESRYQETLSRHYPGRWSNLIKEKNLPDPLPSPLVGEVIKFHSQSNRLCYLHPVSGPHLLESFHLRPKGLIYELVPYQPDQILAPVLTESEKKLNEAFWQEQRDYLNRLQPYTHHPYSDAAMVARHLSRCLDTWGVYLHNSGKVNEGAKAFDDALMLNPQNTIAAINRSGKIESDDWGRGQTWSTLMREYGLVCAPQLQYELGRTLVSFGLLRQAAEQIAYAVKAKPGQTEYLLAYTEVLLRGQAPKQALALLASAQRSPDFPKLSLPIRMEFIHQESRANAAMGNYAQAEQALLAAQKEYPKEKLPLVGLFNLYLAQKDYPKAIAITQQQLTLNTNNAETLMNLGALYLQTGEDAKAIAPLEQAVKLRPEHPVILMNHANAKLRMNDLAAAEKGFLKVAVLQTNNPAPLFYLGEIAARKDKKDEAIRHYETFLAKVPANSADAQQARQRLQQLKGN
ncbi:MAG TPA: tetratricopeptide repeat protein [Verrucomicrobiae bacterium]